MSDEPSRPEKPGRKRRTWFAVLGTVFGVPLLLFAVLYPIRYRQCKAELEAEIARIHSRGEPLWFSDLDPGVDENAYLDGDLLIEALGRLEPLSDEFRALIDADPPTSPGDYPAFRSALAANRRALDEIVEIAGRSECRFRYDYETKMPYDILLTHVDQLRSAGYLLEAEFLQAHGTGEEDRAVAAIVDALDLAEVLRDDPLFVCQLVRSRWSGEAVGRLQTILGHTSLSTTQFQTIDDRLTRMEERFRLMPTCHAERSILFTALNQVGSQEFAEVLSMCFAFSPPTGSVPMLTGPEWKNRWWGSAFYRPHLMLEQAFVLRMMSRFAACVDLPGPAAQRKFDEIENDLDARIEDMPVNRVLLPAHATVRGTGLEHRQRLISARLGLRVCRHLAEHGSVPESLEEVLDEQMGAVPAGLFSGKPLLFERQSDGFAISDVDPESGEPVGRFEVSRSGLVIHPAIEQITP